MTFPPPPQRRLWRRALSEHWFLFALLLLGSIVAIRGLRLAGQLSNPSRPLWPAITDPSFPRACSSTGTVFAGLTRAQQVIDTFHEAVSGVVTERERLLSTPVLWACGQRGAAGEELPMPQLDALAEALPGWHDPVRDASGDIRYERKPVTFASFSSILAEFHREYECALIELQGQSLPITLDGYDQGGPDRPGDIGELTRRAWRHSLTMEEERKRSSLALERTLLTLRSFEANAALGARLTCLQREVLDLRGELGLLADAVSCLPKIWDSVTSLHQRTSPAAPP